MKKDIELHLHQTLEKIKQIDKNGNEFLKILRKRENR